MKACDASTEYENMKRILGDDAEVWRTLQHQFTVLHQRTQTIFGLGGLAITVTGFSGQRIVAAGLFPAISFIAGLGCVLAALLIALVGVSRLRWTSKCLKPGTRESFEEIIRQRDGKTRQFRTSLSILLVGLFLYVLGISYYLVQASAIRSPAP